VSQKPVAFLFSVLFEATRSSEKSVLIYYYSTWHQFPGENS